MAIAGRNILGIDIGHASIRVVGLTGIRPKFVGCSEVFIDQKYLQKEGYDNHELIAESLLGAIQAMEPHKIKPHSVCVTISESVVFRKLIELPEMKDEDELKGAIILASNEYFPDGIDQVELDYQVLGVNEINKLQQIMIVAIKKKVSDDILKVLNLAKLTPILFEPKPESVGRAYIPINRKSAALLLDIGNSSTTVSAYDRGIARVTSSLNAGLFSVKDFSKSAEGEIVDVKLPRFVDQIVEEIEHVRKFYANRAVHYNEIKDLYLSGAGAVYESVETSVKKAVDVPISNSGLLIDVSKKCDKRYYGALGAGLYPWHFKLERGKDV